MEYAEYMPHINVNDGKNRVMNNLKLYMTLLGKFKGRQMADDLLGAIKDNDSGKIVQYAHALRGTAGNLGFPTLLGVTEEIESLCKVNKDCAHLCDALNDAVVSLEENINKLISSTT